MHYDQIREAVERNLPPAPQLKLSTEFVQKVEREYDAAFSTDAHVLPSGRHLPHTGYPFMKLADQHRADYGDVLIAAEWLRTAPLCQKPYEAPDHIRRCLRNVSPDLIVDIAFLVALPVYERGGPHL